MSESYIGISFDLSSGIMSFTATFETNFSCHKDLLIAATDDYLHFHLIVLSPLTDIFQLINRSIKIYTSIKNCPIKNSIAS